MPTSDWFARWRQLDCWLCAQHTLWQSPPFFSLTAGWAHQYPAVFDWLSRQDESQCLYWHQHTQLLIEHLQPLLPALEQLPSLLTLDDLQRGAPELAPTLSDTPVRKSLQSRHLVAALAPLEQPMIDWCCGKGHLARALAANSNLPVQGLEKQPALVQAGNQLAQKFSLPVAVFEQDVCAQALQPTQPSHVVALHACGDLHRRLLREASNPMVARVSFSPCCYAFGRHADQLYQPLSRRAQDQPEHCQVTTEHLRLAVQESVTAPARVRAQRIRVNRWRLGFDALQRQLRDQDSYLNVPSHPARLHSASFEEFCRWAAHNRQLLLPENLDFDHWEGVGRQRYLEVMQQELLRHLFRRPLELWLALDYVLFLEEQNFSVRLGEFCPRDLTPRNLLIDAIRIRAT